MAPKNQPSRKVLQKRVGFTIKHDFDEDSLDPRNSPALAQQFEMLKAIFHGFADDPDGLEKMFWEFVVEMREEFVRAAPRLRVAYATVIKPQESEEISH